MSRLLRISFIDCFCVQTCLFSFVAPGALHCLLSLEPEISFLIISDKRNFESFVCLAHVEKLTNKTELTMAVNFLMEITLSKALLF